MLDKKKVSVKEQRLARKAPLTDAEVRALLKAVDEVVVSKGKASRRQTSGETGLDELRGPTGNFRAPMVRVGRTLLVGFNETALAEHLR